MNASTLKQKLKKNKIARIYTVIRYGMLKQGIVQVIGEILFI